MSIAPTTAEPRGRAAWARPRLVDGTELLGEYQESGRIQAPYLIRRADGRTLEVSPLLHRVAAALDGERDLGTVATEVSAEMGRPISADSVAYLMDHKLAPLGVVAGAGASAPPAPSIPAVLGLAVHTGVVPKGVVRAATAVLLPLFLPAVVAVALVGLVGVDAWSVAGPGIGNGLHDLVYHPALLLMVVGLTLVAAGFHELGHATASRYGGAEPGAIGAGVYLIWPVFYNDLNDSYRLGRTGRLRADLGGVYFNVIFILVLAAVYALTGFTPLLVAVVVQHLAILQQFLPFLRLDGYYVVSDVAGVPDLFGRIKPVLSSLVPGRPPPPVVAELKPKARAVVTAWVLVSVPLLMACVVLLAVRTPRFLALAWRSLNIQVRVLVAAWQTAAVVPGLLSGLQLVALGVPFVGLAVMLGRVLRAWRRWWARRAHHRRSSPSEASQPTLAAGAARATHRSRLGSATPGAAPSPGWRPAMLSASFVLLVVWLDRRSRLP